MGLYRQVSETKKKYCPRRSWTCFSYFLSHQWPLAVAFAGCSKTTFWPSRLPQSTQLASLGKKKKVAKGAWKVNKSSVKLAKLKLAILMRRQIVQCVFTFHFMFTQIPGWGNIEHICTCISNQTLVCLYGLVTLYLLNIITLYSLYYTISFIEEMVTKAESYLSHWFPRCDSKCSIGHQSNLNGGRLDVSRLNILGVIITGSSSFANSVNLGWS